jgi:hypothetical protein
MPSKIINAERVWFKMVYRKKKWFRGFATRYLKVHHILKTRRINIKNK